MSARPSDIPALRLQRLKKLIERFQTPPNLYFVNLFTEQKEDSDTIKWESTVGFRGMTPFSTPGAKADVLAPTGVGENSASAAYWKEKIWYGEEFLNNLREPGTAETYEAKERRLARDMQQLKNREMRRREWMIARMMTKGTFNYQVRSGLTVAIDYGIPDENLYALTTDNKWGTGSTRNIVRDIMDAKLMMANANGAELSKSIITSEVLNVMVQDTTIHALLAKSAFGNGDLFAQPGMVLQSLLGLKEIRVYDEQYQVRAWLTASVTGGSTTSISVDETSDFEVGDTLRFVDPQKGVYEDETISAVSHSAGTITVTTAPTLGFKVGPCFVYTTKKFVPVDQFTLYADEVEGQPTAEFMLAPFGLGRLYGAQPDEHETWDPDGIFVRIQNKGLPVLYNNDAIIGITVL